MKSKHYLIALTIGLIIIGLIWVNSDIFAQETGDMSDKGNVPENVPFIDRDGDGINDVLQHGWGLRFLRHHKNKKRQKIMIDTNNDGEGDTPVSKYIRDSEGNVIEGKLDELVDTDGDGKVDTAIRELIRGRGAKRGLNPDGTPRGPIMIDTNKDGEPDTPFRVYMRDKMNEKMNELVDTDNDGTPDTPFGELMRKRFGTFDRNNDGKPDVGTPEEIRKQMLEIRKFRIKMRQRMKDGLPPVIDEDGDGIPDDLPPGMMRRHRGGNKPGEK